MDKSKLFRLCRTFLEFFLFPILTSCTLTPHENNAVSAECTLSQNYGKIGRHILMFLFALLQADSNQTTSSMHGQQISIANRRLDIIQQTIEEVGNSNKIVILRLLYSLQIDNSRQTWSKMWPGHVPWLTFISNTYEYFETKSEPIIKIFDKEIVGAILELLQTFGI